MYHNGDRDFKSRAIFNRPIDYTVFFNVFLGPVNSGPVPSCVESVPYTPSLRGPPPSPRTDMNFAVIAPLHCNPCNVRKVAIQGQFFSVIAQLF